ncbi:MAG: hypothetical protein KAT12_06860 [Gammaproteobacteria bacterium]|nr:hypothetical protein [Gammaproteobacteria bacterium]
MAGPVYASLSDQLKQSEIEAAEEITVVQEEKTEQEAEYHIYKELNPDDPCDRGLDTYDYEKSWYDETQVYVNARFCEPALWFDNFFANDRLFDEGVAGTYIRWRNEFTYDEEEHFKFKTAISASVELPGAESRLRLTFEGDEDEDLRDIAPGNGEDTTNSFGLQLDVAKNDRSKFNVNVSLSPKIRLRYRYTYPVFDNLILRFTQELERKKQINKARSLINYEHVLTERLLFRATSEGKVSEEFEGVDWLQAFVMYQRIDNKTSLSYETSVNGITEPRQQATNYRLGFRFRKNFHREWLFYEIAPEVTWPITYDEERLNIITERRSKWLLFFRLEVHFGNAHKKRYKDYN